MSLTSEKNFNLLASILSSHPLVKINKELLLEQLRNEIFEMDRNKEKYNNNLLSMNKKIIYNMTQFKTLSTIKIKQREKLSNFDIRLKEQQEEFNNFNRKKPDEIDFRDKIEEFPISSLDETLKKREEELKNILKSNKKKINKSLFKKPIKSINNNEMNNQVNNQTNNQINNKKNNQLNNQSNNQVNNPQNNKNINLIDNSNKEILKNQKIIIDNQDLIMKKLEALFKN